MPIDWISPPETNLPFDSATRYLASSTERLACSGTLEHYLKIGSVQELPPETSDGLSSTFFSVPKKGTNKMRGCVHLCKLNNCIRYEQVLQDGGASHDSAAHLRQRLNYKSGSQRLLHALPHRKADHGYMRFMWEGRKYECIDMPLGLTPALRLATKMMAPVICYLRSCGLQIATCIGDLVFLCRSYKESIAHTQLLVHTLRNLRFPPNRPRFLGTQVNSKKMHF